MVGEDEASGSMYSLLPGGGLVRFAGVIVVVGGGGEGEQEEGEGRR